MTDDKLEPCPFGCNAECVVSVLDEGWKFAITCCGCKMRGPQWRTKPEAIAAWNTRALDAVTEAMRDPRWDVEWFLECDGEVFSVIEERWSAFCDEPADCFRDIIATGPTALAAVRAAIARGERTQ